MTDWICTKCTLPGCGFRGGREPNGDDCIDCLFSEWEKLKDLSDYRTEELDK